MCRSPFALREWAVRIAGVAALIAMPGCAAGVIAALAAAAGGGGGGGGGGSSKPPTIQFSSTLATDPVIHAGQVLEFNLSVTSLINDSLSLHLLNPPPGCVFTLTSPDGGTSVSGNVRWTTATESTGLRRLVFRGTDNENPNETRRFPVDVRIEGNTAGVLVLTGDVTGDGILDTVAGATGADESGKVDVGRIYVWSGAASSGDPTATLFVPTSVASDRLGSAEDQGIQLADVTGDGVLDVIAGTPTADVNGVTDVGAIYVWRGGPGLIGSVAPFKTLTVPGAISGDALGGGGTGGQSIQIADVTGDGILDVVAGAASANVAGVAGVGAIYVWKGGFTSIGPAPPFATLTVPGAVQSDRLGNASGQGFQIADVTGDGDLDIIAGAESADVAGVVDAGAIYVWKGGLPLSGSLSPSATLTVPGAVQSDRLGFASGQGIQLADVTGDGDLDIVAGADSANVAGVLDAGAIYVWKGGSSLNGSLAPFATLTVPGAVIGDSLGFSDGQAIDIADVTGFGVLDVVACAELADVAGVVDTGAIYVWEGGPTLTGSVSPFATLIVPGAAAGDALGHSIGFPAIQLANVMDNSVDDVVAGTSVADVGGVTNAGAIYIWKGGTSLSGTVAPSATLTVPGAAPNDNLGFVSGGIQIVDVTGDGFRDLVCGTDLGDVSGVVDAGAIYMWKGGPSLSGASNPSATLTVPGAKTGDQLGRGFVQFARVAGNGVLDVVATSAFVDVGGITDAGAIYVWEGGSTLSGSLPPSATLTVPSAVTSDKLGNATGQGVQFADVTSDGELDVVACTTTADVAVADVGAIYVWKGGSTMSGQVSPFATLTVPGAVAGDRVGTASGQGFYFADLNDDCVLDVIGVAQSADVAGVVDTGAIYVWPGGAGLNTATPTTLSVPGAQASDQLGR